LIAEANRHRKVSKVPEAISHGFLGSNLHRSGTVTGRGYKLAGAPHPCHS
jgi:hypothetical protein